MELITRQINRARRRLLLQQFINITALWLFALLMVAAVAVLMPKVWAMEVDPSRWMSTWLLGAIGVSLFGAALTTWLTGARSMDAAIEVDRRFGLKERLSSSLALSATESESQAGQALLDDAVRKAERIDVGEQFGLQGRWFNFLPLVPAVLVFILAVFVPDATKEDPSASASAIEAKRRVENSTDQLKKKLAERRKLAEEEGLEAAKDVFTELEKGVDELKKMDDVDQKKALVKLNNLAEELQQRRTSLGDAEKLRQKLNQLKNLTTGPADRMSQAVKKGDFNTAMKELAKLQTKIAAGQLSDQDMKKLAEQLKQLSDKMNQLVASQQEAKQELQREIQRQRESGNLAKAAELQSKLDQLNAQDAQLDKLAKMAEQMAKASQKLNQRQLEQAAKALSELADNMSEMQGTLEQMELLDDAMAQLASAKNSMFCESCQGEGCSMCQGGMSGLMAMGRSRQGGMGMGEGRGVGDRPEAQTDNNFYDSRVRANASKGRAVVTGLASGPNVPGQALEEIKAAIEAGEYEADDPLSGSPLPKDAQDHVRDYFEQRSGAVDPGE
jgi:hypothetical protein